MLITVASGNIFRRELASYVLGEAGYQVDEARDLLALVAQLVITQPELLVIDLQLVANEPVLLKTVCVHTSAPLLWIVPAPSARPPSPADERPSDQLVWPFASHELLRRAEQLLAYGVTPPLRARQVGETFC